VAGNSADKRNALSLGLLGDPLSMYAKAPVTRLLEKLEWSLMGPVLGFSLPRPLNGTEIFHFSFRMLTFYYLKTYSNSI